jgi:hypothetical protein
LPTLNGHKIANLRAALGLTSQRALAERTREADPEGAGIATRLVWDAENGKHVSSRTHHLIAKTLGVPPETLAAPAPGRRLALGSGAIALVIVLALAVTWAVGRDRPQTIAAVRANSGFPVRIRSVRFSGEPGAYSMEIYGRGFGASPFAKPFTGRAPCFAFFDTTERAEVGYTTDRKRVEFLHWDDRRIVVAHIASYALDAVTVFVWNPQTHEGASWGGTVSPPPKGSPQITSVAVTGERVTISGRNFGPSPGRTPFSSNNGLVVVFDAAYHPWGAPHPVRYLLGAPFFETRWHFAKWTAGRIVIDGVTGPPPIDGMQIAPRDPVAVVLWNPTIANGEQRAAWGGFAQ